MKILTFHASSLSKIASLVTLVLIVTSLLLYLLAKPFKDATRARVAKLKAPMSLDEIPFKEPFIEPISPSIRKDPPTSHLTGQPSDRWAPLIIEECQPGLSPVSAPCIQKKRNHTNLIRAQELIYPSFKLGVPLFLDDQHKRVWIEAIRTLDRMRISNDQIWAEYPTEYGQNLVFNNAIYHGDPPPDIWLERSCMVGLSL